MNKKGFIEDMNWVAFAILLALALVGLFAGFAVAGNMGDGTGYSLGKKAIITVAVIIITFVISNKMFD